MRLRPLHVLAAAWLILLIYAYPGQLSPDSFDHLTEARTGIYTDSHPPLIPFIWSLCEYVFAGPFGMLILQSVAFLAGLYYVLRRTFAPLRAAWLAAALFVYPPVFTSFAVIWKDCMMAGALAVAMAGLLSTRRRSQVAALVAIALATGVRYNAIGATLPLVVLLFEVKPGLTGLKRYALAFATWLGVTVAAFSVNAALTDQQMYYWHSSLGIYDIAGTLSHVDEHLPDAELEQLLSGTDLQIHTDIQRVMRERYTPRDFFPIVLGDPPLWKLPVTGTVPAPPSVRDSVSRAWRETLTTHPGAYLAHRLDVMAEVLSLRTARLAHTILKHKYRDPGYAQLVGIPTRFSHVQHRMTFWAMRFDKWLPLYVPWIYLLLSLLMVPLARKHRDVLAILASGLVMEATLLPLAPTPDYRYSHWMVVCTLLAMVILVARRYRAGRALTPSAASPPAPSTA